MIKLDTLAAGMYAVAEQRQKNGANIKTDTVSMLKHCATEVVEATEAYCKCWFVDKEWKEEYEERFAGELADIVACVLIIAHQEGIDMEEALTKCLKKNKDRADGVGDKK